MQDRTAAANGSPGGSRWVRLSKEGGLDHGSLVSMSFWYDCDRSGGSLVCSAFVFRGAGSKELSGFDRDGRELPTGSENRWSDAGLGRRCWRHTAYQELQVEEGCPTKTTAVRLESPGDQRVRYADPIARKAPRPPKLHHTDSTFRLPVERTFSCGRVRFRSRGPLLGSPDDGRPGPETGSEAPSSAHTQ
jgi:hypothetical protein